MDLQKEKGLLSWETFVTLLVEESRSPHADARGRNEQSNLLKSAADDNPSRPSLSRQISVKKGGKQAEAGLTSSRTKLSAIL